jgi:hypothetical protein
MKISVSDDKFLEKYFIHLRMIPRRVKFLDLNNKDLLELYLNLEKKITSVVEKLMKFYRKISYFS